MIGEYLEKALKKAVYEREEGHWYGEIPGFPGVWSQGRTKKEANTVLREVLEGWLLLKIRDRDDDIPVLDGIDLDKIGVSISGA